MDEIDYLQEIRALAVRDSEKITAFLRDIVCIPSSESQIKDVGERIAS